MLWHVVAVRSVVCVCVRKVMGIWRCDCVTTSQLANRRPTWTSYESHTHLIYVRHKSTQESTCRKYMKIWKHVSENYGKPLHVPVNPHFPYLPDQNYKLGVQLYRTLLVQIHPHESSWIHIASSFKLVSSPGTRFSRSCIPLGDRKLQAFEYFDFFGTIWDLLCSKRVSWSLFWSFLFRRNIENLRLGLLRMATDMSSLWCHQLHQVRGGRGCPGLL